MSESNIRYPAWEREYHAALTESDPAKLIQRIQDAETAIFLRLQSLTPSSKDRAEGHAIEDALHALRVLKREKLDFPDWEKK